jgi:beta-lactamase regulating signal transducer with metallopeptidase domain
LIVPMVWLAGVVVLARRQLVGWRAVGALARSTAAPGAWALRIDELRRQLGIGRAIAVRTQPDGAPFTAYARRPIVWLPARWEALPAVQRDALAAHELGHVRRLDWIWNAVQRALEIALWFHPAARWLGRQIRQDREHACDDLAVATCGDPSALVEALVAFEHAARGSGLQLAAAGGELVERTRRLLAVPSAPSRVPVAVIGALALGAVPATQLALPRDMLLGLRVDASTHGALTPGTYRDITTDAFLDQRHYHGAMGADGALHESYEEAGEPRPIDPAVRGWLDELIAIDAR